MKKRLISMLLVVCMALSLLPMQAFAALENHPDWEWSSDQKTLYVKGDQEIDLYAALVEKNGIPGSGAFRYDTQSNGYSWYRKGNRIGSNSKIELAHNVQYFAVPVTKENYGIDSVGSEFSFTVKHYYALTVAVAAGAPADGGINVSQNYVVKDGTVEVTVNEVPGYTATVKDSDGNIINNLEEYKPTKSTTLTVSYSNATGSVTVNNFAGGTLSKEIAGTYSVGDTVEFTATPNAVNGNVAYYVSSITVDGVEQVSNPDKDRNARTVSFTVEKDKTHAVVVSFGEQKLSGKDSANVKFNGHASVSVAGQMNGGDIDADVAENQCLEEEIFEALAVSYFPDGIEWNTDGVTYQYYPYGTKWGLGGEDGYHDNSYNLDAVAEADNWTVGGKNYSAFGDRFADGGKEKVIVSYNGLTIEAEITLVEGRDSQAVALSETYTQDTPYEYENATALDSYIASIVKLTKGDGAITSVERKTTLSGSDAQEVTYHVDVAETTEYVAANDLTVTTWVKLKSQPANITFASAGTGTGSVNFGGLDQNGTLAAGTYTLTVTPDDLNGADGSAMYVDSVSVTNGTLKNGKWENGVYTADVTVANDTDVTVTITYGTAKLENKGGTLGLNGYVEAGGFMQADTYYRWNNLKANVLNAVLGDYGDIGQYTVYAWLDLVGDPEYRDVTSVPSTSEYRSRLAVPAYGDTGKLNVKIVKAASSDGKIVALTLETTVSTKESRTTATNIALGKTDYTADTLDQVKAEIQGNVKVGDTAVTPSNVTLSPDTALTSEKQTYTATVTVPETAEYVASSKTIPITAKVNTYTVKWVVDGKETTETYAYGETPSFKGSTDKDKDAQYTYTFAGWEPAVAAVTTAATYTAQFEAVTNKYTVQYVDKDGKVWQTNEVEYGSAIPGYNATASGVPEKTDYTHSGWELSEGSVGEGNTVVGDLTYTATFTQDTIYSVTFKVNGEVFGEVQYINVTKNPNAVIADPGKPDANNEIANQIFTGWDADMIGKTPEENLVINAQFVDEKNNNNVLDEDETGTIAVTIEGPGKVELTAHEKAHLAKNEDGTYTVLFDSKDEATKVVTVTATPNDTDKTGGSVDYVISAPATVTVAGGQTTTVDAKFGKHTLTVSNGTIKINGYYEFLQNQNVFDTLKADVLTAAGLDGTNASNYTVKVNLRGNYYDLDEMTGLENIVKWEVFFLAVEVPETGRQFAITDKSTGVSDTVTMNVEDSRTELVITDIPAVAQEVDSLEQVVVDSAEYTINGQNYGKVTVEKKSGDLPAEGETGTVIYTVTVAENENWLKTTKDIEVSVTNKSYSSVIDIEEVEGYTVAVTDKDGNAVADGAEVATGTYTVTVTPDSANGYYVSELLVNEDKVSGSIADYKLTAQVSVTNAETIKNTYTIAAVSGQRVLSVKEDVGEIYYNPDIHNAANVYQRVFKAAIESTEPGYDACTVTGTVALGEQTFTITWKGDKDQFPTVSKTVVAKLVDTRAKATIEVVGTLPALEVDGAVPTVDMVKAHLEALAEQAKEGSAEGYVKILCDENAEIEYTIPADIKAPASGETVNVAVTIKVSGGETYAENEETITLPVYGKEYDSNVTITENVDQGGVSLTDGNGDAVTDTDPVRNQDLTVTVTPYAGWFVESVAVKCGDTTTAVEGTYADTVFTGKFHVGFNKSYEVQVTYAEAKFVLTQDQTLTFYHGVDTPNQEALYEAVIKDPQYSAENVESVQYLARTEGQYAVDLTAVRNMLGQIEPAFIANIALELFDRIVPNAETTVTLGEKWLDVGTELTEGDIESVINAEVDRIVALAKAGDYQAVLDAIENLGTNIAKEAGTIGCREFGEVKTDAEGNKLNVNADGNVVETLHVIYKDDIKHIDDNTIQVTLADDRAETTIEAKNVTVTYGQFDNAKLMELMAPVVKANGSAVATSVPVVLESKELAGSSVGEYTAKLSFAGDKSNKPCTTSVTVTVEKAPVSVNVVSTSVRYGADYGQAVTTDPAGVETITFVAGLDVADATITADGNVNGLMGTVQIILPQSIKDAIAELDELEDIAGSLGLDLDLGFLQDGVDIKLSELTDKLGDAKEALGMVGMDNDVIDTLLSILGGLEGLDTSVADLTVKFGGDMPEDIGVYLLGAVTADANYETAFNVGYLAITPDGHKAELEWIVPDDNAIVTLPAIQPDGGYDLSAEVTKVYEGTIEEAQEQLVNLFVGVDMNGDPVFTTDQYALSFGAYAELAFLLDWGNEMYYAEPIARAFVVTPEVVDVQFVDANDNNQFYFVYDGQPKELEVMVKGQVMDPAENENLTVNYIGVSTSGENYKSTTAPTHAGVYTAIATYVERDGDTILRAGVDVAVMAIDLNGDATITVEDKIVPYGGSVDVNGLITSSPADAKVAVITAGLGATNDVTENGLAGISGNVNIDFPARADEILKEYFPKAYTEKGVDAGDFADKITQYYGQFTEWGLSTDTLDQLVATLNQLPTNATLTFHDNAAPSAVGAYLVMGLVFDPDYKPVADVGVVVIVPEVTEAELQWNMTDANGIITLPAVADFDFGASAFVNGEMSEADTAKVQYLFVGMDEDGGLVLTADKTQLGLGAYSQVAYILDVGAEMTVAEPILRGFVVVPQEAQVVFDDANSNNAFQFVYDGTGHGVTAKAFDNQGNKLTGEMTITYTGLNGSVGYYNSTEAPVNVGTYAVVATFVERDESGEIVRVGMEIGALVILPNNDAVVTVEDKIHTYTGSGVNVNGMVTVEPDEVKATVITMGLDTTGDFSENGLEAINGTINVDFPERADQILAAVLGDAYDKEGVSSQKFVKQVKELSAMLAEAGLDMTAMNKVLAQIPANNQTLSFLDNYAPSAIGAYLVTAVVTDPDYMPKVDAGVLLITPQVDLAELEWNMEDDNGVITRPVLDDFDFTATAFVNDTENADATAKIKLLFVGVNAEGNVVVTAEPTDLTVNGAYTQVAYIPEVAGAQMFASLPIVRSFVVVPQTATVEFVDENGNNARQFTYTGEPIAMPVVVYDMGGSEIDQARLDQYLTVRYIGVEGDFETYNSTEAPTEAGIYTVIATYVEKDESGDIFRVGMNVGVMVIQKADMIFGAWHVVAPYDGLEHRVFVPNDQFGPVTVDYLSMIVDKQTGNVNFVFEDDLNAIVAAVENLIGKELPNEFSVEYLEETLGIPMSTFTNALIAVMDAIRSGMDVPTDPKEYAQSIFRDMDAIADILSDLGETKTITFNGKLPVEVGVYDFYLYGCTANYKSVDASATLFIEPIYAVVDGVTAHKAFGTDDPDPLVDSQALEGKVTYYSYEGREEPNPDQYGEDHILGGKYEDYSTANDRTYEKIVYKAVEITELPGDPELAYAFTREEGETIGSYDMSVSFTSDSKNFVLDQSKTANNVFSIIPGAITVTVADASKVYGEADPELTYQVTADVNGEEIEISGLDVKLTREEGEDVGEYAITAEVEGIDSKVTVVPGKLTITPKPVVVVMNDQTKVYGQTDPAFTYTVTDKSGNTINEQIITASRAEGENAGEYAITGELNSQNYSVASEDMTSGKLTITKKSVTVKVDDMSVAYGDELPDWANLNKDQVNDLVSVEGLVHEEDMADLTIILTSTAPNTNALESYTISVASFETQNYAMTEQEQGTLTVIPKDVIVTVKDASKVYGEADPAGTREITGLVGEDTLDVSVVRQQTGENVGTYALTANVTGDKLGYYDVTVVPGKLTITPAEITITGASKSIAVGDAIPTLGENDYTVTGLVGEDALTKAPTTFAYVDAEGHSVEPNNTKTGTYGIQVSGAEASGNYTITYVNGTLTIGSKIVVTANDVTAVYGSVSDSTFADGNMSYSMEGYGVNVDELTVKIDWAVQKPEKNNAGEYSGYIHIAKAEIEGYDGTIETVDGDIIIQPKPVTVEMDDVSVAAGTVIEPEMLKIKNRDSVVEDLALWDRNNVDEVIIPVCGALTDEPAVAGTYEIGAALGEPYSSNYTLNVTKGTLTVTEAPAIPNFAVKNYTGNKDEDTWTVDEENMIINVRNDLACVVLIEHKENESYTRLTATAKDDGSYDFDISGIKDGEYVVILVKGDVYRNGIVDSTDITFIRKAILAESNEFYAELDVLSAIAADVTVNDYVDSTDITFIRKSLLAESNEFYAALEWDAKETGK